MSSRQLGLTMICQYFMPDGEICGKTWDNCHNIQHKTQETTEAKLDGLIALTNLFPKDYRKKVIEDLDKEL